MREAIKNRYEFIVLFDVENGNPNGDPDAGNMPRIDPESGLGLVTDVCLKRKIRNYVETVKENKKGFKIYIKEDIPLNRSDREACEELGISETDDKKLTEELKKLKKSDPDVDVKLRNYMCDEFYDIRRRHDNLCKSGFKLRPGERTGAAGICPEHRPDHQPGSDHHESCDHHGKGCGKQEYRNGQKEYCPLWSLSRGGLCFRKSGAESDRIFGRGSGVALGSDSEYVRK